MPWLETAPMEQRERFVRDDRFALYTMTELCDRYDISRKTGYKWLERFDAGGRAGLSDRSRAPHQCPHRITDHVAALICLARRQHPSWGPEKLLQWLEPRHPDVEMPAVSTAGDLLARKGLVKKRRRRRPTCIRESCPRRRHSRTTYGRGLQRPVFRTRDGIYAIR